MDQKVRNNPDFPDLAGPYQDALSLPSATFDAMRSFLVLAATRNLSETVRILGITRQTIRRHISLLEAIKKTSLFSLESGVYRLTESGSAQFQAVRNILALSSRWASEPSQDATSLESCRFNFGNDRYYLSCQHRLIDLMQRGPSLLKRVHAAWVSSEGQVEGAAFKQLKPYVLVYREQFDTWLCVHAGERTVLATWLGPVWSKSVIGSTLENDPVYNPSDAFPKQAYRFVMDTGSCRYDHVAVKLSRGPDAEPEPVNYHRLLLPCCFPDGSPALMVATVLSNDIDLGPLGSGAFEPMPVAFSLPGATPD